MTTIEITDTRVTVDGIVYHQNSAYRQKWKELRQMMQVEFDRLSAIRYDVSTTEKCFESARNKAHLEILTMIHVEMELLDARAEFDKNMDPVQKPIDPDGIGPRITSELTRAAICKVQHTISTSAYPIDMLQFDPEFRGLIAQYIAGKMSSTDVIYTAISQHYRKS